MYLKISTGGNTAAPHQVRIQGCTQMPCTIQRGTDAVMELDFTPANNANNLTPSVIATVLGLPVIYPLPDHVTNSCSHLLHGARCPVPANQRTTLLFRFPVNAAYPPIAVAVQLTVRDHLRRTVACFSVDIQVRV